MIFTRMFSLTLILVLMACVAVATPAIAQSGSPVSLVNNGQAVGRIYVSQPDTQNVSQGRGMPSPAESLQIAAEDLQLHIEKMSGAKLEIQQLDSDTAPAGPGIILGKVARNMGAAPTATSDSQEGFRILTKGNQVLIGGQSDYAVMLGSYHLLRSLGCDWVMPGDIGMIIPEKKTVAVPATDVAQAPDFLFRRLWYRGWRPRVKDDYDRMRVWTFRQMGGSWDHPASTAAGHNWDALVKRHKDLFEKDPTMLALVRRPDGTLVRSGPQIETTHPGIIKLYVDTIKATYEKNIADGKWTKDTAHAFPIGPADGLGYSLSAESLIAGSGRIDPIVGEVDRTDELVLLGNRILEEVHKTYPNAMVGCYSYSTHADYPARYKPNPKYVQIFAPINFSRFHSALDTTSKTQPYYKGVAEQWAKLSKEQGNPLIYRGYNWNLADNMLLYSKLQIWGEELPWYHQLGFLGLNVEATKAWSINGPSDYVFMRLAWDTSLNWKALLTEYCAKAYGPAAKPMEEFFLAVTNRQRDAGQEAGSYHAYNLLYDDAFIKMAQGLMDKAKKATKDAAQLERIAMIEHSIEATRLYLEYHKATLAFDFPKAQQLYQAMNDHWKTAHDKNADIVANETPQYLKRFLERFVNEAVKYSTGEYKMVYQIPDELPTLFDPLVVGHRLKYQSPDIVDDGVATTRTISTTWDAQGLAGMRDGAVWYRVSFKLDKNTKGKPIGLFIGGVEDEARVWINGKSIGTSGRGFSVPFVFDLTDEINYDGENLLAVQVVRNSKANEIGLGGIIRPSFLFTGPQLERKSPKPLELRRILPGGELGDLE